MHWTIAAPFIDKSNLEKESWLTPYVPNGRHKLDIVPRSTPLPNWHERKSDVTEFREWMVYWEHAVEALKATEGGIITVFPQLPALLGMQRRIIGKRVPVVSWFFTVNNCYGGMKQALAQYSLGNIDYFIVQTQRELELYHKWLGIPKERFEIVHFHEKELPITYEENNKEPFITALGSAHRDFPTLFKAVEKLNIPTVVASGKRALAGLTIPDNVQTPFGISKADCLRLNQEARINIVPLLPKPNVTAAGLVTIVEAMHLGRAIIATKGLGPEDYITHGETGLLVEPESVEDLTQAIELLWNDAELRNRLGQAARRYAQEHFSPEAAGKKLGNILDKVADKAGMY
jgi:glycosyltransferase involved in cell wall biosynthesis